MAQNFFITGLPRSRTAWFAAYFTAHPNVWCWHEGLQGCYDPAEFQKKMEPYSEHPPSVKMGNSDSALPLTNLPLMFPDAPVVVIHRKFIDSMNSTMEFLGINNPPQKMIDTMNATHTHMRKLRGLHVAFDDIDERMVEISQYVGIPFREDIHDLFQPLNIQTTNKAADIESYAWLPFAP